MPSFTIPNTQTGGSQTVSGATLGDATKSAQAAGTWSPAAGTYGANSGGSAATNPALAGSSGGGGGGGGGGAAQVGGAIDSMLSAIASGNKQAFDEAVREYNQNFGLSQQQFQEQITEFNKNLQLQEAGLTGTYNGQPTQAALAQQANFSGYYGGQQTMQGQQNAANIAAQQAGLTGYFQAPTQTSWNQLSQQIHQAAGANYNDGAAKQTYMQILGLDPAHMNGGLGVSMTPDQLNAIAAAGGAPQGSLPGAGQGQATLAAQAQWAQLYGGNAAPTAGQQTLAAQQQQYAQQMGMINQAAALQANPFRQQQAIGQMGRLLGGQGVAGFSAPNTVQGVGTVGGNNQGGMGYMQQMIDDIRDPSANSSSMNDVLGAIPTPNKINSNDFLNSAPSTQSMVLQGMQEKYGLDPSDSLAQIKATMPQFNAPNTLGTIKRG